MEKTPPFPILARTEPVEKSRQAILRDSFAMWQSLLLTQALSFFLAVYIRRALGPAMMGVWAILQVFLLYSGYSALGIYDGACREIPLYRGKGDLAKAKEIRDLAFTFAILMSVAVSAGLAVWTLWHRSELSALLFWGWMTVALLNILQRWNNFSIGMLYTDKLFVLAAKLKAYSALVNTALTVGLVYVFGLYGMYLAMIFSFIYNIGYYHWKTRETYHWRFNGHELAKLIRLSLTLLAAGILFTLIYTADKIVIGKFLGLERLGVYSLAILGSSYVMMSANMFTMTLYPRILERYGKSGDGGDLLKFGTLSGVFLATYLPVGVGFLWVAAPWLVHHYLPDYAGGLIAFKRLMFGTIFLSMVTQVNQVIVTANRQMRMVPVYLAGIALAFTGYGVCIVSDRGIGAVAFVSSCSFAFVYVIQIFVAFHAIQPWPDTARYLLFKTFLPVVFVYGALAVLDMVWSSPSIWSMLLRIICFVPVAFMVAYSAEKDLEVYKTLSRFFKKRPSPNVIKAQAVQAEGIIP